MSTRPTRRVHQAPSGSQLPLLLEVCESARSEPGCVGYPTFQADDPRRLVVGDLPLEVYLKRAGQGWVLVLRQFMESLDYSAFVANYDGRGRRPYHPRVVLGLLVYGILQGRWSLRDLESLARLDVGAWWICGGKQPDHSVIGRFVQRHADVLTEAFFIEVTRAAATALGTETGELGIDGTTVEAAASAASTKWLNNVKEAAAAAKEAAARSPHDADLGKKSGQLQRAIDAGEARLELRVTKGKGSGLKLAPHEPEAVHQPLKNGLRRASYKPVVAVHETGLIVGQHVEASCETAAVAPLLKQHLAVLGAHPQRALLDAGFHSGAVLKLFVENGVDVLCPSGNARDAQSFAKSGKKFPKNLFIYDVEDDVYRCPGSRTLHPVEQTEEYVRYRGDRCGDCLVRDQCTSSKRGRQLTRYAYDDYKEGMQAVFDNPRARKAYKRRAHIAETPFARLKENQGLTRFRRRGLKGAAVEFALHCIAYNLLVVVVAAPDAIFFFAAVALRDSNGRACVAFVAVRRSKP